MYRVTLPFVVSLALVAPLHGCEDPAEDAGGAEAGGAGAGGNDIAPVACDILEIWKGGATECQIGSECSYDTTCTGGGERRFRFTCETLDDGSFNWRFNESSCEQPFESCYYAPTVNSASVLCTEGEWDFGADEFAEGDWLNCPRSRPREGDTCDEDYNTDCGYRCPTGGWVIHECIPQGHTDVSTHWSSNGVCVNEGEGGAGGQAAN